jgi:hypothetical protein
MSSKPVPTKDATADQEVARRDDPKAAPVDMKFEIVVIPRLGCGPREGLLR